MSSLSWVIYYTNNKKFSNLDGGPEEAPGAGCLAIVKLDEKTGYKVIHGGDYYDRGYYWWEEGEWFIGNTSGLMQYQVEPGWKKVVFGRTVSNKEWARLWERIETDFGPKASYWLHEPRKER